MSYWFPFRTETAEHLLCHCCLFLNDQVICPVKAPSKAPTPLVLCEPAVQRGRESFTPAISQTTPMAVIWNTCALHVTECRAVVYRICVSPVYLTQLPACTRKTNAHPKWTPWITPQCSHNNGFQSRHKYTFPELAELGLSSNTNSKLSTSCRNQSSPQDFRSNPSQVPGFPTLCAAR